MVVISPDRIFGFRLLRLWLLLFDDDYDDYDYYLYSSFAACSFCILVTVPV